MIGVAAAVVFAVMFAGWRIESALRDIRDELRYPRGTNV